MQNTRFNSVRYETTKIEIREGKKYWEIFEKCILLFFPFHLIHRSNYRKILPYICNGIFFQFYFAFSKEIDQYIFFCEKRDTRKRSTIHLINLQLIFYSSVHFFLNIWNLCQTFAKQYPIFPTYKWEVFVVTFLLIDTILRAPKQRCSNDEEEIPCNKNRKE